MAVWRETLYGHGMSDDSATGPTSALITRLRGALQSPDTDADTREIGLRILSRTERVVGRLEGAAETLQTVAKLELALLRRMAPIVDDLGELMRHTLDEARERRGLGPRAPKIIDIEAQDD
jgi:hypothetical protein